MVFLLALFWATVLVVTPARAQFPSATLPEVAQAADLIFIGTMAGQASRPAGVEGIVTDVWFKDVKLIHATQRSRQSRSQFIRLTHAGGEVAGRRLWVSVAPVFQRGRRYLIMAQDDGGTYANPVVGGPQGKFQVIKDQATGQEFLLDAAGCLLLGLDQGRPQVSLRRVSGLRAGVAILAPDRKPRVSETLRLATPPKAVGKEASAHVFTPAAPAADAPPMALASFAARLRAMAAAAPLDRNVLKPSGPKRLAVGGETKPYPMALVPQASPSLDAYQGAVAEALPKGEDIAQPLLDSRHWYGNDLYACGVAYEGFYPNFSQWTMEQVAETDWQWNYLNEIMYTWNLAVNFYRYSNDNRSDGWDNGANEFLGFVTDDVMYEKYGYHWGTANGMTFSAASECCGHILETDVMFNPAFPWTTDLEQRLANPSLLLYQQTAFHESGHVWGLYRGYNDASCGLPAETYCYNSISVMNNFPADVVEDARGLHTADAYLMRESYANIFDVPSFIDLGVESYYASNGIKAGSIDNPALHPGQPFTFNGVTVENISDQAVSNVRLRIYLTADRVVDANDHEVSQHFDWQEINAGQYSTLSVTVLAPDSAPPGEYYLGFKVTHNGDQDDDFAANDTTTSSTKVTMAPLPPQGVAASDGDYTDRIHITWLPVNGATSYQVFHLSTLGSVPQLVAAVQGATDYWHINPLEPEGYYMVRALSPYGTSLDSSYDFGCLGLEAPAGLTASTGDTGGVYITWQEVDRANSYLIWRSTTAQVGEAVTAGQPTGTAFLDETAVPGQTYYYWVQAQGDCELGPFSSYVTGMRAMPSPSCTVATDGDYDDRVLVNWCTEPWAETYEVWRDGALLASGLTSWYYDDNTAVPERIYSYTVCAANSFTNSQPSPADQGHRTLAAPATLNATKGEYEEKVQISWLGNAYADEYTILRSLDANPLHALALATQPAARGNTYADATAQPSGAYAYWVRAINSYGQSALSPMAVGWVKDPACSYELTPPGPQVFDQEGGEGVVTLNTGGTCLWQAQSGVDWITLGEDQAMGRGSTSVTFTVAPYRGTETRTGEITIAGLAYEVSQGPQAVTLAMALDNDQLSFLTGGDAPWSGQTEVSQDGEDAAASGAVGDGQESWLQTTILGPGDLSFAWGVASQPGGDVLEFLPGLLSGLDTLSISGLQAFQTVNLHFGEGEHVIRWRFRKDSETSMYADQGWVDQVIYTRTCDWGLSTDALTFPASGGEAMVTVDSYAQCPWQATTSATWLDLLPSQGEGDGSLVISASNNNTYQGRSAKVEVQGRKVTVTQMGQAWPLLPAIGLLTARPDTDGDGLSDALELAGCTSATNPDSDGDGIPDGIEDANHDGVLSLGETSPCKADSDGDGIMDGEEDLNHNGVVDQGETDPLLTDTDGDGMPDKYEVDNGLDPLTDDAGLDKDGDGFTNKQECDCGTRANDVNSKPIKSLVPILMPLLEP